MSFIGLSSWIYSHRTIIVPDDLYVFSEVHSKVRYIYIKETQVTWSHRFYLILNLTLELRFKCQGSIIHRREAKESHDQEEDMRRMVKAGLLLL